MVIRQDAAPEAEAGPAEEAVAEGEVWMGEPDVDVMHLPEAEGLEPGIVAATPESVEQVTSHVQIVTEETEVTEGVTVEPEMVTEIVEEVVEVDVVEGEVYTDVERV